MFVIKFETKIPNDLSLNADPLMQRSISRNLVSHAIKYSPKNRPVNLDAQVSGKMIEVCIQDFGVGMTEKTKNTILSSTGAPSLPGTNQELGTGLGLLLVKDFVAQHGGKISIESELRKGTCFKFTIPAS